MPERGIARSVNVGELVAANPVPPGPSKRDDKPIRRLTVKHRRMLALHLQGLNHTEIAGVMECHPATVGAVIRNPTAQLILGKAYEEFGTSLKALMPLAIGAIRDGLVNRDARVALAAVDRLQAALDKVDKDHGEDTTEDVIRRIIRIRNGDQEVQIAEEVKR